MNELVRSTIGVLALLGILVLTIVNTCQLDAIERKLGDQPPPPPHRGRRRRQAAVVAPTPLPEIDPLVQAPGNRLVPAVRAGRTRRTSRAAAAVRVRADPPGLNRLASKNAADMRELYGYIGNTLARRHPEDPSIYGPELAVNLTESDDGLTYMVHLRKGVLWHEPTVDWDERPLRVAAREARDGRRRLRVRDRGDPEPRRRRPRGRRSATTSRGSITSR